MSFKDDLTALVSLQSRELDLERVGGEIAAVERDRAAAHAELEAAKDVVESAEADLEAARAEAKRLELDLQTAEDKVAKFKDHMLSVKTNQELWALQEEIGHAEAGVGEVETRILEQLEIADRLEEVIGEKKKELDEVRGRVEAATAAADRREAELVAERDKVNEQLDVLRRRVPDDLMNKYESIKRLRGGIGVAETLDSICLACNFKVRPQLYVETVNLTDVTQCENCGRILYVAERLDLAPPPSPAPAAADLTS